MKTSSKGLYPLDEGNSLRSAQGVFFDVHTAAKKRISIYSRLPSRELGETFPASKKAAPPVKPEGRLFCYSYFFLARERMTSSVTMHRSIVMSMSGRVFPTMMSTFISRRYSTKPITQMMRLRAS